MYNTYAAWIIDGKQDGKNTKNVEYILQKKSCSS